MACSPFGWRDVLAVVAVLGSGLSTPATERVPKPGDTIANLAFKDIRYLPRSLSDFPERKAFVLVFSNTSCPVVQRYWPSLKLLEEKYRGRGVQFLSINAGADDSIPVMAAQAIRFGVPFPFVKDTEGDCVKALGVQRTPEVVVLDAERKLRYRGRIDDQIRLGGTRQEPSRHDLREAIDDVLEGRDVKVAETPVDGCLITLAKSPAKREAVTFAEHVAPLLKKHCQECHRPGTAAPFSLVTYKQAAGKAAAIAEVVTDQRMPPWYASPEHGSFINRRGLEPEERDTILAWSRSGAPLGDESKLPAPLAAAEGGWRIGKPDLVLQAPLHELPAAGDIPYKYVLLPYAFPHDTWLQGIQILPDNLRVVHHCNMAYIKIGDSAKQSNFVTGTVPGGEPMQLDSGVGFLIPKGSTLLLQIHYISTGKPEKCQISVGFRYAKETIQKQLRHYLLADYRFAIPPGAPAHPVSATKVLDRDALGIGLFSHMHLRGKDMTFRAHYPDGKAETLLVVPNFSFNWQMPYKWQPGTKLLPKGTRLECLAHYDNSSFNPYNPDPAATVKDGQQTHQEMMNGFVFFVDAKEELKLEIDPTTGKAR